MHENKATTVLSKHRNNASVVRPERPQALTTKRMSKDAHNTQKVVDLNKWN